MNMGEIIDVEHGFETLFKGPTLGQNYIPNEIFQESEVRQSVFHIINLPRSCFNGYKENIDVEADSMDRSDDQITTSDHQVPDTVSRFVQQSTHNAQIEEEKSDEYRSAEKVTLCRTPDNSPNKERRYDDSTIEHTVEEECPHLEEKVAPIQLKCAHTNCGKVFQSRKWLLKHSMKHGTGNHELRCHICDAVLKNMVCLQRHLKLHGSKPHECPTCGKRFTEAYPLKIHMIYHTGEKPFKCDECDRAFVLLCYLKMHKRRNHTEGKSRHLSRNRKVHRCGVCGKGFKTQRFMLLHTKVLHSLR